MWSLEVLVAINEKAQREYENKCDELFNRSPTDEEKKVEDAAAQLFQAQQQHPDLSSQ